MGDGRDEEGVIGDDRRAVDRAVKLDFAEDLFLATGGEDDQFAVLGATVNFTIGDEGGGPDAAIGGVHPEGLAGLGVEAVNVAVIFGDVDQTVDQTRRADGATDALVQVQRSPGFVLAAWLLISFR